MLKPFLVGPRLEYGQPFGAASHRLRIDRNVDITRIPLHEGKRGRKRKKKEEEGGRKRKKGATRVVRGERKRRSRLSNDE